MSSSTLIDEAFATLEEATFLEKEMDSPDAAAVTRVTVAAKYFHACGLLDKAAATSFSVEDDKSLDVSRLLVTKSSHYKVHARNLLQRGSDCVNSEAVAPTVDAKLSEAIDYDEKGMTSEAINAYRDAALGYMKMIQEYDKEDTCSQKLKTRLTCVLDRAEQLKANGNSAIF